MMESAPDFWRILAEFGRSCNKRGWEAFENGDLIQAGGTYNKLVSARTVHPSSFRKIAASNKCIIREEASYCVVEAAYTAWLFSETPSDVIVDFVISNPELSSRVALYDFSRACRGKGICMRLNLTDSKVFKEFENYIGRELGFKLKQFPISHVVDDSSVQRVEETT